MPFPRRHRLEGMALPQGEGPLKLAAVQLLGQALAQESFTTLSIVSYQYWTGANAIFYFSMRLRPTRERCHGPFVIGEF